MTSRQRRAQAKRQSLPGFLVVSSVAQAKPLPTLSILASRICFANRVRSLHTRYATALSHLGAIRSRVLGTRQTPEFSRQGGSRLYILRTDRDSNRSRHDLERACGISTVLQIGSWPRLGRQRRGLRRNRRRCGFGAFSAAMHAERRPEGHRLDLRSRTDQVDESFGLRKTYSLAILPSLTMMTSSPV